MNINKAIFRGIKVATILMVVLLIVYGVMRGSFAAYNYGYRLAIESLTDSAESVEGTEATENTESTGE